MRVRGIAVAIACTGLLASMASAALTPLDSNSFSHKFEMNGTTAVPDDNNSEWTLAYGGGAYTGSQTGGELYLSTHFPPSNSAGAFIFLTSVTYPAASTAGGAFTYEVAVRVDQSSLDQASSDRAFSVVLGDGSTLINLEIGLTSIWINNSQFQSGLDNSSATHVYRVAHDSANDYYYVWRDGVAVANDIVGQASAADTLYFGDGTGGWNGASYTDYFRWTTGGYSPAVPEPGALSLAAIGLAGMLRRRRA